MKALIVLVLSSFFATICMRNYVHYEITNPKKCETAQGNVYFVFTYCFFALCFISILISGMWLFSHGLSYVLDLIMTFFCSPL